MIYDPKMAKIPGVNPIYLNSLKDYEDFLKWQKASGLKCPILHLEKEFNAQGFEKYEVKKSFSGNCENTGTGPMNHQMPVLQKEPSMGLLLDANKNNDINWKNRINEYTIRYIYFHKRFDYTNTINQIFTLWYFF